VVKRHYQEPHWEKKRAQVIAFESITLYGLTVASGRRVGYARIDPALSRELFIRRALVEGEYETQAPFVVANRELVETVESLEDKVRRRDLLVDEETLVGFYSERHYRRPLSAAAISKAGGRSFPEAQLRDFYLSESDVLQRSPEEAAVNLYPDELEWHGLRFELRYHFEPGSEEDGVSIRVPLMALSSSCPLNALAGWCRGCFATKRLPWSRACLSPCGAILCRCPILRMRHWPTSRPVTSRSRNALDPS